jgi:tRNA G18 (ribose-2'-O)-methylase SpoU
VVVLDNLRSAFNVGAILRTVEFLGIQQVCLVGITPGPFHPKVIKTSLGAERNLNITKVRSLARLLKQLKSAGYFLAAVEQATQSKPYFKVRPSRKSLAVVFGNEVRGIRQRYLDMCDEVWEIPKLGKAKESLNVAVSCGIVLSELVYHHL